MKSDGTFSIERAAFADALFKREPFTELQAWIWLQGAAAFQPTTVWIGHVRFDLKPGQLAYAIRFLAAKFQWTESRTRRFLGRLKRDNKIDALATPEATIITIRDYGEIQFGRRARDALTDEPTTNKRRKEESLAEEVGGDGGGSARAREFADHRDPDPVVVTPVARTLADELAVIAGYRLDALPPQWCGAALEVERWLKWDWPPDLIREVARITMAKKKGGPPYTISYFAQPIGREVERLKQPAPEVSHEAAVDSQRHLPLMRSVGGRGEGFSAMAARLRRRPPGQD